MVEKAERSRNLLNLYWVPWLGVHYFLLCCVTDQAKAESQLNTRWQLLIIEGLEKGLAQVAHAVPYFFRKPLIGCCLATLYETHLSDAPVDADRLPLLELGLAVLGRDALPVARRRQPRVHVSHHLDLQILGGNIMVR